MANTVEYDNIFINGFLFGIAFNDVVEDHTSRYHTSRKYTDHSID